MTMGDQARVVIIGAGIVGCSAAYHLAELGWTDVVVVDQGPLYHTGGSTSHAPGLMFQLNASPTVTALARYSADLYERLRPSEGPGYYRTGSLEVATSPTRWAELKRKLGHALSWGLPAELISAQEASRIVPLLRPEGLYGALHVHSDGVARAVRVAATLAAAAQRRGVRFQGGTMVTAIEVAGGRVRAVVTSAGRIEAENVLVCAGIWGPAIGRMAGVTLPLTPVQHQYVTTTPLAALAGQIGEISQPIVRHQDRSMYFRQHGESYGIGSYGHQPLVVEVADIPSHQVTPTPSVLPFTAEHFAPALRHAAALMPALANVELASAINGMFSFTPDGQSLLGESPDVRGFWVAEAVWVTHGGGTGKVIAEWLVEGTPSLDLHELDLNRFHAHALTHPYVIVRGAQQYREVYDIIHPLQGMDHPRGLRRGPFYERQKELGAVFLEGAGWERPQWFEANAALLDPNQPPARFGWAARNWSPVAAAEHRAARERAALFDLSPFTKLEVSGPGALDYLQGLTCNQMDTPLGKVTYTALLNERGGIECDLTVTRLGDRRFLILTGAAAGRHDLAWLRRHLPDDGSVTLTDVTSGWCCLGLWGPAARAVLGGVCADDLSDGAFPYFSARQITVGYVPALALRVSYVGELGWEIYAPTEYGAALWETLWEAGQPWGLTAAGGAAFDSLRLEKGYRLWGSDITPEHTPYEAGLGFAVRLRKGDFLGRAALIRQKEQGPRRRLVALALDDPRVVLLGKEPILSAGRVVGYVTSATYGYTVGQSIAYGYLPTECAAEGARVEAQYFGELHGATVVREPLYDPHNQRMTSAAAEPARP